MSGMHAIAEAAAQQQGFGEQVASWYAHSKETAFKEFRVAGILAVVFLILLGIAIWVTGFRSWPTIAMIPVALVAMAAGVRGLIGLGRAERTGVFLYRTGLVRVAGEQVTDAIDLTRSVVNEEVVQRVRNGRPYGRPIHTFVIEGPHGSTKLKGDALFEDNALPRIKLTAAEAKLPMVQAALQRGEEVPFGKLTLTGAGFRVPGGELIGYPEVTSMTVRDGTLEVAYGTVNQRTHSQQVAKTPDFVVLSSLLQALSGKVWA
ncbi:DUF6585 family protein [Enemella sp. A6]|uniref:DUF6585 family protein n=1 Tax=Enemella sp. A6 TaxID=3440152 RepID=UPI003EB785B7